MALVVRQFLPALSVLLLLRAGVGAVETHTPDAPPAALFEFSAGGATSWALDPGQPTLAEGGVTIRYEGVLLQAERLTLRQALIPGTTVNVPAEVDLLSAQQVPTAQQAPTAQQTPATDPKAQPPPVQPDTTDTPPAPPIGQVVLDTRGATLATIGFKGLLSPSAVNIRRLPPDAARPGIVSYHVALPDTGSFSGLMQTSTGWAPFRGWARNAEFTIEGDLRSGALANLRVTRIALQGSPTAVGDQPRRRAEITRLKSGVDLPPLDQPVANDLVVGHLDAQTITISFDTLGRPSASAPANRFYGDPGFLNLRELGPAKTAP